MRGRGQRMMLFLMGGMFVCLLSSYINTFLAVTHGASALVASIEIAPLTEEFMKFCPILFYLLVFEPSRREISDSVIMTAVGFATFENACYLAANGAEHFIHLMLRGVGTGAMHVVCGVIIASGLFFLWDRIWMRTAGTLGLLSVAVTYHAIYNILVSQHGAAAYVGYAVPILTVLIGLLLEQNYPRR
jgi:RsiW-degrading membrane proteinase PrsW (M82 family)